MNVMSWKRLTKDAQKAGKSEQSAGQSDKKPQPENTSRDYFRLVLETDINNYSIDLKVYMSCLIISPRNKITKLLL